jgi:hypothetical protein
MRRQVASSSCQECLSHLRAPSPAGFLRRPLERHAELAVVRLLLTTSFARCANSSESSRQCRRTSGACCGDAVGWLTDSMQIVTADVCSASIGQQVRFVSLHGP